MAEDSGADFGAAPQLHRTGRRGGPARDGRRRARARVGVRRHRRRRHPEAAPDATPEPVEVAAEAQPDSGVEPPTTEDQATEAPAGAVEPVEPDRREAATTLWESPDGTPTASLPWLQARSPDDRICPFLRAVAADDRLGFPVESPDAANRCASMHEAVPQSLRQQELVCLTPNHVDCRLPARGRRDGRGRSRRSRPPEGRHDSGDQCRADHPGAVIRGIGRVRTCEWRARDAVARCRRHAARVGHIGRRGGDGERGLADGGLALGHGVARLEPTPAPSATPIPSPSATPIPSPSASASAATGPTPMPTSSRYRLLEPCPNKPNCWIYTVRAGDNLYSIAKYFGVPLSTVHRLNPWTRTESLRARKKLILPPPIR